MSQSLFLLIPLSPSDLLPPSDLAGQGTRIGFKIGADLEDLGWLAALRKGGGNGAQTGSRKWSPPRTPSILAFCCSLVHTVSFVCLERCECGRPEYMLSSPPIRLVVPLGFLVPMSEIVKKQFSRMRISFLESPCHPASKTTHPFVKPKITPAPWPIQGTQ